MRMEARLRLFRLLRSFAASRATQTGDGDDDGDGDGDGGEDDDDDGDDGGYFGSWFANARNNGDDKSGS